MRKSLSPNVTVSRLFLVAVLSSCLFLNQLSAQCGLSSFAGPGSPYTPGVGFTNTQALGSGTYDDFNVTNGNIYSFYVTSPTAPVTGYDWDLTVSSTSAVISYNNSVTPLQNSWTGGVNCPQTSRPTSTEWFATYSGTLRINVKSWDAVNGCHDFVNNQGSATLAYKECVPTADPGPGNSNWNVDAYATTDMSLPAPIPNARYGYYVDNSSGTNFVSTNYWTPTSNPSTASGWSGCQMPNDNYVVRARRKNFPCGAYTITVNNAANNIILYLNGTQIYAGANITSATTVGQWALSANDVIEVRFNSLCASAGAKANVSIAPISPITVNGGSIGGVANNSNFCPGQALGTFTNITSGSGGVASYNNSTGISYQWELSTDGGATFNPVAGATNSTWTSSTTVPAGSTYVIKRITTDQCGNRGPSNNITVYGRPAPNGAINPASQTICPGSNATLTFNFTSGTAPFNITYTNSLNNYTLNGITDGTTANVSPPFTVTYTYTSITDAYGCTTTSGFNSGAAVVVNPPISVSSVNTVNPLCNGSSDGSITINASGGTGALSYSIDNGNTFQSSNTFTGLPAGSYNIVVKDNLGCSMPYNSGTPVVLTAPSALSENLTSANASCAGVYDGSITVAASGGTAPYSYSLNGGPSQQSNQINNLQPGTYTVYVYDSHNCSTSASVTINSNYTVSIDTLSTSDITCFGQGNGALDVQLSGGIPAYSYSINGSPFQSSGSFTGLIAGNYITVGKDIRGCTATITVNITQPAQLVIGIDSVTNVICNSLGNGAIYTNTTGGTPGYTYSWNNGQLTANDINIPEGNYNVTVTDSRGCTATNGAAVSSPALLSLNIALYNSPFCHDDSTGTILLGANGGVAPYSYTWSNGATTQDIDSLIAGTYTVTVVDANGCQNTISQTLTNPAALTAQLTSTNVTCAGASDGTAGVTASGGNTPYTYLWSTFSVAQNITGLAGGVYQVIVTDHTGCKFQGSVTVNEPTPLVVTDVVTNISCFNANDGSVSLTVTGGTPNYTYAWSNGSTGSSVNNLAAGTITCTVTDANHCTAVITANIINPQQIVATFRVTNVACFGDTTGSINTTVTGGTPGYTYLWSNGATTSGITQLVPGTYIVTITDSRGCSSVDSATVTSPGALYTSGILHDVSCHGLCDGYIFTTPYGGTLPYSFQWSHGPTTENVIQLCGGSYYLTVTDANGCQVASLYIIHEPALLTQTLATNSPTCFGTCNGSVASVPSGGTTPYQYLWNNFATDSVISGLCGGKYTVLLTDSNGCHISDTVTLVQPSQIIVLDSITNVTCAGFNTGAITLTVSGGVAPYTFAWSNSATTQNITGLTANTYTVVVTDAHGCSQSFTYNVTQGEGLHTNVSIYQPRCYGGNDGFISVDVVGGVIPYTYSWSTSPTQIGATATNLVAGTYILTVTDAVSCSATVSANLTNPTPVTVATQGATSRCANNPNGQVIAVASGGQGPYTYSLNGALQVNDTFVGLAPGNYTVLALDANGCQGTGSFNIGVASSISVSLSVTDQRILTGMETQLSAVAVSDTTIIHYFWYPIAVDSMDVFDYTNCPDSSNCSTPYVKPPYTQTFTVVAMNADSCVASDTVTVFVDNQPGSFMPTAFTPNNDGLNDRFAVAFLGATKIEVTLYSRWGEKLYYNANQTNNVNAQDGWDGTAHGKDAPEDTYVWQANVTYFDGTVKKKTGTVSLIR